ncbi:sugar ABC transporter substrate-binding protein [Aidingimonas halophila]|uniref:Monosaccharide ABC transporter substrate-binding protein, CUT2 family n=1 Tax=Aidingimonas halophila TaxID=574349 RepID=A0A1H2ZFD3_9GAMM|nr:sugar ABC transporter substrate-binding protein [Aidingimonas halophila]GHC15860.1 sugar ABC transporter substrate-binding protein [Aidingimonas halophila]SDX15688.1 monosaccharide ABC transporter substrate-binding protein, CUT2 family [Aidingimonas halophila]
MALLPRVLAYAVAATSLVGAAQAQDDDERRIVMVTHGQAADPFWSVVKKGAEDAADEVGADLEYRAPTNFDVARMQQLVEAAIASEPDALILSLVDPDALGDLAQEAADSGLPVIVINTGGHVADEYGADIFIGSDPKLAGKRAAERMIEDGAEKGLCINQEQGNVALDLRCEGFEEGFDGNAEQLATGSDPTEIRNSLVAYLNQNSDVDALLSLGPLATDPIIDEMREQGALEQFHFGTFDLSPTILEALVAEEIDFAIDQQPYLQGYQGVVTANQSAKHLLMPATDLLTGPAFVTPETAEEVQELTEKGVR